MKKRNQLTFFERPQKRNSYEEICSQIAGKTYLNPDEFGQALRVWSRENLKQKLKIVALFSGAGGLDIGFCDAGFELVESVELEAKFVKSMQFNQEQGKYFKSANILCEDIRKYEPQINESIDFVIGGPPCQSFSAAGRRAAGVAGTRDDRGSLFEEYVRVIKKLKPKGFLFENVYGLLGAEKGESIKKIVQAFKEIGYNTKYRVLDAADYGTPQHRERIIIVGSAEIEFKFPKPTHGIDSHAEIPHFSAQEALYGLPTFQNDNALNGRFGHLLNEIPPGLNYSFFTEKMGHPEPIFAWRSKFSDFLYKADPKVPVRTLKASGGQYTGPFHWENRHFNVEELKRLQTFPDDYQIIGNKAIASKQIGNSVPPQFARILAISVLDQFFDVTLPFNLFYLEENEALSFRNLKRNKSKAYAQIAVHALDSRDFIAQKSILPAKFKFELKENFKLIEKEDAPVIVEFDPTENKWTFKLTRKEVSKKNKEAYRIEISNKKHTSLFAGVTSIVLISCSTELLDYTLLWKVFEQTLAKNNIKADLVQLNGYYQYTNDINYRMTVKEKMLEGNIWKVVEMILVDPRIGQIIDVNRLAENYELSREVLITCFMELRKIGFEIRNSSTNKEMDENHYLIPYKFPTLTPLSVQLKKSLSYA